MVKAIVGACWGDEGKGKITDILAEASDIVVRFQGGSNAGHTIITNYGRFALHQLPSGIFRKNILNIIGNGVALSVENFIDELKAVTEQGVPMPNILISNRCQIVMPYHKALDGMEEARLASKSFGSTKSGIFAKAHPERHFNMGIAESDMVATAAGLATTGKIPFVNTFTVFLTTLGLISARAQVCYGNLNVKFGGAYCGMSDALDGATHHATEDIAVMRSLPNMTVLVPSDATSTRWATKYAVDTYGPMYLRLSRDVYPDLYDENTKFECGKGAIVRDGTDVTVIACGILVHKALEAAEQMAARGVSVRVVDMYSIKPIDRELILRCAQETGAIVTAEEHNIYGGLGSAVAEVLAWGGAAAPTEFVGIPDTFTETGKYTDLLAKYGVDAAGVVRGIERVLARKH